MGHPHYEALHMSDEEIRTLAIVAAMFFCGSHEKARIFLSEYNYIPNMLSKSQLNRRLHAFEESFWQQLLYQLSRSLLHYEETHEYAIDSFPVSVCDTPLSMEIMPITTTISRIFLQMKKKFDLFLKEEKIPKGHCLES